MAEEEMLWKFHFFSGESTLHEENKMFTGGGEGEKKTAQEMSKL